MKKYYSVCSVIIIVSVLSLGLLMINVNASSENKSNKPKTGQEQLIVKFKTSSNVSKDQAHSILKNTTKIFGLKEIRLKKSKTEDVYFAVQVDQQENLEAVMKRFRSNPEVEAVQLNYLYEADLVPNDPSFGSQWAHTKTQATTGWDVTIGNPSVSIAIIGTGVNFNHPDLAANIWQNSLEIPSNSLDDDGNGYIDDINGWDFRLNNNNPMDIDGHDTSVAGIAAAVSNNGTGIAGVCWVCKIMPLKVAYTTLEVANAVYYAVDNGARIINMSFGNYDISKYGPDTVVDQAINYALAGNILVVATAGNNSVNTKRYPGAHDGVIGVSSTDSDDNRAGFSNWGDWVDVAAPGASVLSTSLSGYESVSGTSFSAPYVAGLAGLLFSQNPNMTIAEARRNIEYNADKITTDLFIGSGRVNVDKSMDNFSPTIFSVIKKPNNNNLLPQSGLQEIWGTSLGNTYVLEYRPESSSTWITFGSGVETINGILGNLDVGLLSGSDTFFDIRLTSINGVLQDTHVIQVAKSGPYQSGWPRNLENSAILSSPNVYDVDGNGDLEVIVGTNAGKVFVYNHDGTILSGWPQDAGQPYIYGSPAVGDIDGDGDVEIVTATYGGSGVAMIKAWNHDGSAIAGWPKHTGSVRGSVLLINLDADQSLEIVSAFSESGIGKVYAWNGDGSLVPGWPYQLPESNVQSSPAGADFNNDGTNDVIVCTYNNCVVLDKNGSSLANWTKLGASHTHPVITDVDGNGTLDVLMAEGTRVTYRTYVGTLIKDIAVGGPISAYAQMSTGDLNGDDRPEVFLSSDLIPYNIYGWDYNGNTLGGWPKSLSAAGETPTIGDVNGDQVQDVVVSTRDGRINAWSYSGAPILGFPKAAGSTVYRAVAITDLDKDGDVELIVGSENGLMHVWSFTSAYNTNYLDWPFSRHDVLNTGKLMLSTPPPPPPPPPSPITVFNDGFEISEWNSLWTEDSQNDWSKSSEAKSAGAFSAKFGGPGTDSQLISIPVNLQGKDNATITFSWYINTNMDSGEYIAFDVSTNNGSTWVEKQKINGNVSQENTWLNATTTLSGINSLKLRFRGKSNQKQENGFVDQVEVKAN